MFLVYTKAQIFAAIWQLFLHILDLYEWIYSQSSHQQKLDVASEADPANTRHSGRPGAAGWDVSPFILGQLKDPCHDAPDSNTISEPPTHS